MCRRICSAESEIGVSGFLISCATRRATSFHADCFCARKQLGCVLKHEHIANRAANAGCAAFKQRGRDSNVEGAAWSEHLRLGRGRAHAMGAAQHAVYDLHRIRRDDLIDRQAGKVALPPGSSISLNARFATRMMRS